MSALHRNEQRAQRDDRLSGTDVALQQPVHRHGAREIGFDLFDRAPPFSNQSSFGQVMYDPRYADPRGRMLYAQVTLAFK